MNVTTKGNENHEGEPEHATFACSPTASQSFRFPPEGRLGRTTVTATEKHKHDVITAGETQGGVAWTARQ
eukprot:768537-Hanusia_phi.AAC.8